MGEGAANLMDLVNPAIGEALKDEKGQINVKSVGDFFESLKEATPIARLLSELGDTPAEERGKVIPTTRTEALVQFAAGSAPPRRLNIPEAKERGRKEARAKMTPMDKAMAEVHHTGQALRDAGMTDIVKDVLPDYEKARAIQTRNELDKKILEETLAPNDPDFSLTLRQTVAVEYANLKEVVPEIRELDGVFAEGAYDPSDTDEERLNKEETNKWLLGIVRKESGFNDVVAWVDNIVTENHLFERLTAAQEQTALAQTAGVE